MKIIKIISIITTILLSNHATAQWQPEGPIKFQVGFGAGGVTDTLGRIIAASIEKNTGWDIIIENKPGGGGVAMFSKLSATKADGQTIGLGVNLPILINLALRGEKLPFKADSFDYLGTIAQVPLAIVASKDAPFNTFKELVDYSAKQGGVLISFDAKPQEMVVRAVNKNNNAKLRLLSQKSDAQALQSVLGGHAMASFVAGAHIKYIESGQLKLIAVATSERHDYSPQTPTLREQGFDYALEPMIYVAAPKGLPTDVKAALAAALDTALTSPDVIKLVKSSIYAAPNNLGADKTLEKMVLGLDDIKSLTSLAQ
jgi:tripartite-type tricarboxylate transporter receptor subunit TctC